MPTSEDYWQLCDHLSIFQSIMLILGYDPSNQNSYHVENNRIESIPEGYHALKTALVHAVITQQINGSIKEQHFDYHNNDLDTPIVDLDNSIIEVTSLKEFLQSRGHNDGFFFPDIKSLENYLDANNSFFAPKLAAAIHAWKAVTEDESLLRNRTPKQALEQWLGDNARTYGLIKDDGTLNNTGIQEICKIANWKPEGGATKTPTHGVVKSNSPTPCKSPVKLRVFGQKFGDEIDECPF